MSAYRWLGYLEQALSQPLEWFSSLHTLKTYASLVALYEAVLDRPPSEAGAQVVRGHDHRADSGWGAVAIPRGLSTQGASGDKPIWVCNTVATAWSKADKDYTSAQGNRSGSTWMAYGYVPTLLTSSGSPPSSAPYLEGYVLGQFTHSTAVVQARLVHTSGAVSGVATLTSASTIERVKIPTIPCIGASWNGWDLEIYSDTSGVDVSIFGYQISGVYKDGGSTIKSQPVSGGSDQFARSVMG